MIFIIFSNNKSGDEREGFSLQLEEFRQEVVRVRSKNIAYIEDKINKVSEKQDNYQVTTSSKLYILEQKIQKMELEDKKSSRIVNVNNNNSNATLNVPSNLP